MVAKIAQCLRSGNFKLLILTILTLFFKISKPKVTSQTVFPENKEPFHTSTDKDDYCLIRKQI